MSSKPNIKNKPSGIFVFIDDDTDEHFLLKAALTSLGITNKVVNFHNGAEAFRFLRETNEDIFMIISDLNMPVMDGLELRRLIEITPELKIKAIPFIFHSNTGSPAEIRTAYASGIQGFLKKASSLEGTISSLQRVIDMWTDCIHPKDLAAKLDIDP